jgi:uncharacterized protein (DUF2267 family)
LSFTGVDSLDRSIHKTNAWLADVADSFGTDDRRFAYRVTRAWFHTLRDRLGVDTSAHLAAQLPELLRGVFYDGWDPKRMPAKYGRAEYVSRFARDAGVHDTDVPKAAGIVTSVLLHHVSSGAVGQAMAQLPRDIRELLEPWTARHATDAIHVTVGQEK